MNIKNTTYYKKLKIQKKLKRALYYKWLKDVVELSVCGPHRSVLRGELAHQHVHVLRVPLPVLTAEVLQQADGLVQTVEDAHHPADGHGCRLPDMSTRQSAGLKPRGLTVASGRTDAGRGRR